MAGVVYQLGLLLERLDCFLAFVNRCLGISGLGNHLLALCIRSLGLGLNVLNLSRLCGYRFCRTLCGIRNVLHGRITLLNDVTQVIHMSVGVIKQCGNILRNRHHMCTGFFLLLGTLSNGCIVLFVKMLQQTNTEVRSNSNQNHNKNRNHCGIAGKLTLGNQNSHLYDTGKGNHQVAAEYNFLIHINKCGKEHRITHTKVEHIHLGQHTCYVYNGGATHDKDCTKLLSLMSDVTADTHAHTDNEEYNLYCLTSCKAISKSPDKNK